MAVTQIEGKRAKQCITINGVEWHLKKDATDSSVIFPFERMSWLNAGCNKIAEKVYCCWILGIIPPTMGSLEKPVSVFTLGFNSNFIPMTPSNLTRQDMSRMHFYTCDYGDFASKFISQFLGNETTETPSNRPSMTPFPVIDENTNMQSHEPTQHTESSSPVLEVNNYV